ncbi:MAG: hypothetical protein FWC51_03605 [Proteobacteria bacterium]|nr:hypothetical protein [Pseudomonadota bacterium]
MNTNKKPTTEYTVEKRDRDAKECGGFFAFFSLITIWAAGRSDTEMAWFLGFMAAASLGGSIYSMIKSYQLESELSR